MLLILLVGSRFLNDMQLNRWLPARFCHYTCTRHTPCRSFLWPSGHWTFLFGKTIIRLFGVIGGGINSSPIFSWRTWIGVTVDAKIIIINNTFMRSFILKWYRKIPNSLNNGNADNSNVSLCIIYSFLSVVSSSNYLGFS